MEYERQIEIKLEGNNCIINFPKEQNISLQNNSLTNIDDISFSVSVTSDEDINSRNNPCIYNKGINNISNSKQLLYSNEKSKLEITYQSIFNSELKSESSNIKTPLLLLNSKNNYENSINKIKQQNKDSVVKRLNFDINSNSNNININNINNINDKNNSEIPNINIRKLPLIKKNNIIKKISKNLNKEYFIHEKIYTSNKNLQRIILDKKIKENSIKNSNIINNQNKNQTQIVDNNIDILNNESFNTNKYQITENNTTKGNLNFLNNKTNNNTNIILNKCASKPNLSNMRTKLNNILKLNTKEKENTNSYKEKQKNNILKDLDIMPKIINNENMNININNINITKKIKKNKIFPSLTSGNNNTNLNTLNSFNKSANNNNKMKSFNINENSNIKTPLILNKQIILRTPKTNSYSCSTSYSAKNNKIQNDMNISTEKDPILIKIEAHNSLLKNFFFNQNNFKNKENKENISNNIIHNDNFKFYINKFNNNTSEKIYGKNFEDESINNNKGIKIKKFNTDFKLPINKSKKISLLTERNMRHNNINNICLNEAKYSKMNNNQKIFQNEEFNYDKINPMIK